MEKSKTRLKVGVILSAGGLRGAAHLGILRRLLRHGITIDVMVGVSAGAIVAAYYAAVGLSIEEMIEEARTFRGRHIIAHGLTLRAPGLLKPLLVPFSGVIPSRLRQLEEARFERLHFGVKKLGIVCHDLLTRRPIYFATGRRQSATLAEAVKASASIPGVIPSRLVHRDGQTFQLVDGGISDSLPIVFARSEGLEATHLIVCDCRRHVIDPPKGNQVVYIRPSLADVGVLKSPRTSLLEAVAQGEAAVTDQILRKIRAWSRPPEDAPT